MADIFDLSDVWNDGATTFTGIGLDVTDTASASGSLLMDLQVGGSSKFQVSKDGMISVRTGAYNDLGLRFGYTGTNGMYFNSNQLSVQISSAAIAHVSIADGVAAQLFSFRGAGSTTDLSLYRDAADTLAQRRSTNPQAFRVYNSYTDGSNYERGVVAWDTNVLKIGTEAAGTGSARDLRISTGSFFDVHVAGNRKFYVGSGFAQVDSGRLDLPGSTAQIKIGATGNTAPMLKRSTTSLQVRLADDSAFTNVQGKITTETAYTAGAPTATGYIVLYDSTGTAYKVPAEAL
jgi:hypothetical protein